MKDSRNERIGQRAGVIAHGLAQSDFDGGSQCGAERFVAALFAAQLNRLGYHAAHVFSPGRRIIHTVMQIFQRLLFRREDELAEFLVDPFRVLPFGRLRLGNARVRLLRPKFQRIA